MTELSIEEKVKRYDEVLAMAKECLKDGTITNIAISYIESIFPELKESDDERIRQELIAIYSVGARGNMKTGDIPDKDIVAWLEKQGESKVKEVSIWKHWKDGICGNGNGKQIYLIKQNGCYSISSCLGFECDYIELSELDKLLSEKQGEQPQCKSALEAWKDMRLEVYQQASGNRHEPNYSDDTTKMFSLNDIDEIIEKMSKQPSKAQ